LYWRIVSKFLKRVVINEKDMNAMIVPKSPKSIMLAKFWKNFFLYMLNPAAKTIGGSTK